MNYHTNNWMKEVGNNVNPAAMTIPGTHDTMAYQLVWYTRPLSLVTLTQTADVKTQLEEGVRFLDLRLDDSGYCYHGPIYLDNTFQNVMDTLKTFLAAHPSETVFVSIKHEHGSTAAKFYKNVIDKYIISGADHSLWYTGTSFPTRLGDIRGKLVFLRRCALPASAPALGVNLYDGWQDNTDSDFYTGGGTAYVQDQYQLAPFLSGTGLFSPYFKVLGKKVDAVKNALTLSISAQGKWFFNFMSHAYMYHQDASPETVARDMAKKMRASLTAKGRHHGIFPMDFYDAGIVKGLIENNL